MRTTHFKSLIIFCSDVCYFRPFTLFHLGLFIRLFFIICNKNWSDSKSVSGPRHQICNDTFMSFAFVNLSELFCIVDFDSNSVLKHVLKLRFIVEVVLREIGGVAPSNLDRRGSLCYVSELALKKRVLIQDLLVFVIGV